jgi:hypothetical protein
MLALTTTSAVLALAAWAEMLAGIAASRVVAVRSRQPATTLAAARREGVLGAAIDASDRIAGHALDAVMVRGAEVAAMPVMDDVGR